MRMRIKSTRLVSLLALPLQIAYAQGTAPTFQLTVGQATYTLLGRDPARGGVTTIPTVLVPITLSFESRKTGGKPFLMDAAPDVPRVLASPVFSKYAFSNGGSTQYGDAMLRTTFPKAEGWHTLFGKPEVKPMKIAVPAGYGYILTSKKTGGSFAVLDVEFLQKELFKQLPKQEGKLVVAITHNATYYTEGDATLCCSWGTHGVDSATGNSFVLGSYLHAAPAVVEDGDVQPLTEQLGEFVNDPLHDPLVRGVPGVRPGNAVPNWLRPASMPAGDQGPCGGAGVATSYFLLEPTNTNPKNNIPASRAYVAQVGGAAYHLQDVALLPWYTGAAEGLGAIYSFPDARALPDPAKACPAGRGRAGGAAPPQPAVAPVPFSGSPNGHLLIGYTNGFAGANSSIRDVSPQWDVIIVSFATPDRNAPEGTMRFRTLTTPAADQFKADIAYKKSQGKKVMISLGGGGLNFTFANPASVSAFVSSVGKIVADYGFDGVDIDLETPSLDLDPGDADFKHPTTPSTVNLIAALRQLRERFGPGFMISLVPEGTQIPSGCPTYGGQFGSYLPITYAIRDILSFIDVQSYNTPPLEGLDGEIYQPGSVDYHAAMTELLLQGFNVGGATGQFFPPMPAYKVAVGFLTGDTTPTIVSQAMDYIITGKVPAETKYKLRQPAGYPALIGAMFWTIDADRRGNYSFSNVVGVQLHAYPTTK
jgi:chitinase